MNTCSITESFRENPDSEENQRASRQNEREVFAVIIGQPHLMDYVLDLHIIIGPSGMCRCGEDGLTCSERLKSVSHEINSALIGAHMAKSLGGVKMNPSPEETR